MCLEMGGIDHQLIWLPALGGELGEDAVEHAHAAPADEPIVERLGWPILGGSIAPAQAIADHEDDTADNPRVIDPGHPVRQRKTRLDPTHLRLRQPDQITHDSTSLRRH